MAVIKKTYVLDTNVLLHDPNSLNVFEDNRVVITYPVLEELDNFKNNSGYLGMAARKVIRQLDDNLENVDTLIVSKLPELQGLFKNTMDNMILRYVGYLKEETEEPVILVTKDVSFRVKAAMFNVECEDYKRDKQKSIYQGWQKGNINQEILRELLQGHVEYDRAKISDVYPNQYIKYPNSIGMYRDKFINLVRKKKVSGILPKNDEQTMAIDALTDPNISLVTLTGKAGTGKTLIALAAALEQDYYKIVVSKPTVPMGKDIGYLPGDEKEKMNVWMKPIYDNLELIESKGCYSKFELGARIDVSSLTFMRGRSIPNQFVIIDEAQNMTPHEVKTITTRIGEKSKLVFTGDIDQIDSPYLDKEANGLTYLINRFKEQDIAAHITLEKGERSKLATLAAEIL